MNRIVSGRINIENVTVKLTNLLKTIKSFSDSIHELSMEDTDYCVEEVPCI